MNEIENQIRNYSSKKLKEIVKYQSNAHNPVYIDHVKDELIRRGEEFPLNEDRINEVLKLEDEELKTLVEREYESYHLEDLEIARKEYLRRGFKNEVDEINEDQGQFEKRYKNLRTIVDVLRFITWAILILTFVSAFFIFDNLTGTSGTSGTFISLMALLPGIISFIMLLSLSELIKVILAIEENTRKYSPNYLEDSNWKKHL